MPQGPVGRDREQAEDAAAYLTRGSHVNVIGRMSHNNYVKNDETVYGWDFVVDEIDERSSNITSISTFDDRSPSASSR
mgnify:CR=1 FL=1